MDPPSSVSARARAEVIDRIDLARLAEQIQSRTRDEVPFYTEIVDRTRLTEVAAHCRTHAETVVKSLREGRVPSSSELAFVRELAGQRARQLNPLPALLHAYRIGYRVTWEAVVDAAAHASAERELVVELAELALRYFEAISSEAVAAFSSERERAMVATSSAHLELVERLLLGVPSTDEEVATRIAAFGLSSHRGAQVVVVELVDDSVDRLPAFASLLSRALTNQQGVGLAAPRHGRVVGIVESDGSDRRDTIASALRVAARAAELDIRAGIGLPCEHLAAVPRSHEEAARALMHTDRNRPIRVLSDVSLLDELLGAADAITRRRRPPWIAALRSEQELLDTLASFVAHDCHYSRTADALGVHTNTVRHRLQRIATITGHDVQGFAGLVEVVIAVRLFV
ncbi:MAG TPA: helix-turn-helix domain-containing protein [Nannocystaceae bacterium]|nr:helix-turn-helix domain-containing protein [Nannocystaceae bacterium]